MDQFVLLAVDDDPTQLEIVMTAVANLEYPPIRVVTVETATAAIAAVSDHAPDMVICDHRLPDGDGADVLAAARAHNPLVPVIIITAHESVEDAVALLKSGAHDYLTKPLGGHDIQQKIAAGLLWHEDETDYASVLADDEARGTVVESANNAMRGAIRTAIRAADSSASILIRGESGTGKELMARLIHETSSRSGQPFVPIHLAALPETLIESELFGHRKGAFTGADQDRVGVFEQADGGTLFIDELGDVPLSVQVKLLRVVQFRQIQRVGDRDLRELDVRIVAATNRDLEEMVREGSFREDLYYRLNVVSVELPPLRDRREDIPRLVETKIRDIALRNDRPEPRVSRRALNRLLSYDYPGNIRELENILERAVVLGRRDTILETELPDYLIARTDSRSVPDTATAGGTLDDGPLDAQLERLERSLILAALERTKGNQSRAAEVLGITERRLRSRLQRLQIDNPY